MKRRIAVIVSACVGISPTIGHAQTSVDGTPISVEIPDRNDSEDRSRAIGCLAMAIAYEAGYEPAEGQQAVAEVILNRVRHAAYPKTVCGVVFAGSSRRTGCQFTFTCDGSLNRRMSALVVTNARSVATAALDGQNPLRVAGATHYHADDVSPYWAPSLIRVAKIGAHIFYRGAGVRDDHFITHPFLPAGEPLIEGLNLSSSPGPATAPSPSQTITPARPAAFAPWGLAPPTMALTEK